MMATTPGYEWDDLVRQQTVTFDVDEARLIATPFDRDLERLPHPPDRAMRVSWEVRPQPETELRPYDQVGTVDGTDNRDEAGSTLYDSSVDKSETTTVPRSSSPSSGQPPSNAISTDRRDPHHREAWVFNKDRYKVQSSVRGFWPVIENMPRHSYLFV